MFILISGHGYVVRGSARYRAGIEPVTGEDRLGHHPIPSRSFQGWGSVSYDVDYHAVFYYQFHIVSVSFHFHFVDEFVGGFHHIYVVIVYLEE